MIQNILKSTEIEKRPEKDSRCEEDLVVWWICSELVLTKETCPGSHPAACQLPGAASEKFRRESRK